MRSRNTIVVLVPGVGYASETCHGKLKPEDLGDLDTVCGMATLDNVNKGLYVLIITGSSYKWYCYTGLNTSHEWLEVYDSSYLYYELSVLWLSNVVGKCVNDLVACQMDKTEEERVLSSVLGTYVSTSKGVRDSVARTEEHIADLTDRVSSIEESIRQINVTLATILTRLSTQPQVQQVSMITPVKGVDGGEKFNQPVEALAALLYSAIFISMEDNLVARDRLVTPKRSKFCSLVKHLLRTPVGGYVPNTPDSKNPKTQALNSAMVECGVSTDYFSPCSRRVLISTVTKIGDMWSTALQTLVRRMKLCLHLLPYEMACGLDYLQLEFVSEGIMQYQEPTVTESDRQYCLKTKDAKDEFVKAYITSVLSMSQEDIDARKYLAMIGKT